MLMFLFGVYRLLTHWDIVTVYVQRSFAAVLLPVFIKVGFIFGVSGILEYILLFNIPDAWILSLRKKDPKHFLFMRSMTSPGAAFWTPSGEYLHGKAQLPAP